MNTVEETKLVMKKLKNLKHARPDLQNLRISPDRSVKDREEVRVLMKTKNLNTWQTGDYIHLVRAILILRVRKTRDL